MAGSMRALIGGAVIAAAVITTGAAPASAKRFHRRHVVLVGAVPRPGYVGAPGFAGGPPGPVVPALVDYPAPMGIFAGVPILSRLGL